MRIYNTLQTNAVLLEDDWCRFLKRHNFLVGVSLDGPQAMHEAYRLDKGGRPTFERVMAGLALLKQLVLNLLLEAVDRWQDDDRAELRHSR